MTNLIFLLVKYVLCKRSYFCVLLFFRSYLFCFRCVHQKSRYKSYFNLFSFLYFIVFLYSSVSIVSIRRSSVGGVARVWGCRGVRVQGVTLKNPPPKSHHSHRMCIFFLTIFVSQLEKSIVLFLSFVRYMWSSFQPNPIHAGPLPTTLKRPSSLGKALRTSSALNFQPMSSKPL